MTNTEISRYDFEAAIEGVAYRAIDDSYSGRGMFGMTCINIVSEHGDARGMAKAELLRAAAQIREDVENLDFSDGDAEWNQRYADEQEELAETLERMAGRTSSDNLGLDVVIYWPGFTFSD